MRLLSGGFVLEEPHLDGFSSGRCGRDREKTQPVSLFKCGVSNHSTYKKKTERRVRFNIYGEINLDNCASRRCHVARDGIMGWSLPLPNAAGGHVHANGLLQLTAAANADAAAALSANYGTAASEVVVSAAHQLRTILSVFTPLANGADGHTQSASTVVGGAVVDIISSTLREVDAFSAAAVDAANFAKRTRALAAGYCDDIADDLIAGDTESSKGFSVAPGDEQTLAEARAAVSQMGPYLEQLGAHRDASSPDFTKAVAEGWANDLRCTRDLVISKKQEAVDTLHMRESAAAKDAESHERVARAKATASSASEKLRNHINRLDLRYNNAVELQADASRKASAAAEMVHDSDSDVRLMVSTANACLALCVLQTHVASHARIVANETLREFQFVGDVPILDVQSSGDLDMCDSTTSTTA